MFPAPSWRHTVRGASGECGKRGLGRTCKDTLSILLFLLSLIWYLKDDRSQTVHDALAPPPSRKWYWLSLLAFALAMFSKGSVVILPLVLLLLVWWEYGSLTRVI